MTGKEEKNDPSMLLKPRVIDSWVASTESPLAAKPFSYRLMSEKPGFRLAAMRHQILPNAFAIATLARTPITGTKIIEEPSSEHIEPKLNSVPLRDV